MADPILLDASAWLSFLLKEEQADLIEKLLGNHPLYAPDLIRFETANGILVAKRGNRPAIKNLSLSQLLDIVQEFPIETVPIKLWWKRAGSLVARHAVTFYDASYVACARALDIPILTFDRKVLEISKAENVELATLA